MVLPSCIGAPALLLQPAMKRVSVMAALVLTDTAGCTIPEVRTELGVVVASLHSLIDLNGEFYHAI